MYLALRVHLSITRFTTSLSREWCASRATSCVDALLGFARSSRFLHHLVIRSPHPSSSFNLSVLPARYLLCRCLDATLTALAFLLHVHRTALSTLTNAAVASSPSSSLFASPSSSLPMLFGTHHTLATVYSPLHLFISPPPVYFTLLAALSLLHLTVRPRLTSRHGRTCPCCPGNVHLHLGSIWSYIMR